MSRQWFAVRTKPREEARAKQEFERQGFTVYLPLALVRITHARKVSWQPRPFFAGYLFLHLAPEERQWTRIRSTYGAVGAVHFGPFYPPVPDGVIAAIRARENERGLIELDRTPTAPFKKGDRVRLLTGSLSGLEGLFQEMRGEDRALILLNWLGRRISAEVSTQDIAAA